MAEFRPIVENAGRMAIRPKFAKWFALLALGAAPALAAYPEKPVRIIVPDAPGSAPDIRARQFSAKFAEAMGQPVVIDNRPGGSMIIGAEAAARAAPDGYTLFLGNVTTHSVNPLVFPTLPYRPDEDFIPITTLSAGPLVWVVHPDIPAKTLPEFLAYAKTRPGKLDYGVVGQGSIANILMDQVKARTGARFESVVYKATAQYVNDLVAGHLHFSLSFWSVVGAQVKAGKLRALAVASTRRLAVAPDVPTFAEAGLPGLEAVAWQGLFVPTGTPGEVVAHLRRVAVQVAKLPEIRNPILELGSEPGGMPPEEFAAFVKADRQRWKKAMEDATK